MVYLYCITDAGTANLAFLKDDKNGLRFIEFGSYTVVAQDPGNQVPVSSRYLIDHYEVNDNILKKGYTVLPFDFGTVMPLLDVHSFIEEKYEGILGNLERFKSKVEMVMKILVASSKEPSESTAPAGKLTEKPGCKYLSGCLEKFKPLFTVLDTVQELRGDIERIIGPVVSEIKVRTYTQKAVLLSIVILLPSDAVDNLLVSYNWLKELYPKCQFLLSGPAPAYHFVDFNV